MVRDLGRQNITAAQTVGALGQAKSFKLCAPRCVDPRLASKGEPEESWQPGAVRKSGHGLTAKSQFCSVSTDRPIK